MPDSFPRYWEAVTQVFHQFFLFSLVNCFLGGDIKYKKVSALTASLAKNGRQKGNNTKGLAEAFKFE